ncbi:MAG TPA: hypothetical protein VN843_27080, partial [Anaerolineales bacterium]|nr:hypothetical protein [Anaerolineales bacterium]
MIHKLTYLHRIVGCNDLQRNHFEVRLHNLVSSVVVDSSSDIPALRQIGVLVLLTVLLNLFWRL